MFVLLNGSPKKNGESIFIAEKAKEYFEMKNKELEIIDVTKILKSLEFPFCTDCGKPCPQICEKKSEKLKKSFDIIRNCKGLIILSPVYFGTVSGEIKAFWDIMRHLRNERALYNKVGAAISVGASRYGGQETTVRTLQDMMFIQGMLVLGNSDENGMGHQGVCFQKPVNEDLDGINSLERVCNRVIEISELIWR